MTALHSIIRDQFRLPDTHQITSETTFASDLGADSFDMVLLSVAIEEEYHLPLPDPFAEDMETIGDIETYLQDQKAAADLAEVDTGTKPES